MRVLLYIISNLLKIMQHVKYRSSVQWMLFNLGASRPSQVRCFFHIYAQCPVQFL